jgi:hypothetical protein
MIGGNTILHLHEGTAMIGADTFVTPSGYKQRLQTPFCAAPGIATAGPIKTSFDSHHQ